MAKKLSGICGLTGDTGQFVKCHIFPEALTKHEDPGQPIFQAGEHRRPIKRMTSWYDPALVTAEGEKILAGYDDWAIKFLRDKSLVWSGWSGSSLRLKNLVHLGEGWNARVIESQDWQRLRLFLLSLLWRVAASKMPEFSEIVLPREDLERLREMVASGKSTPEDFLPATLVQLTTKGPRHNHTPLAGRKILEATGPMLEREVRFFRFFVEGLIIHFERDVRLSGGLAALGSMAVGFSPKLVVMTHPFEGSFQAKNLGLMLLETWENWPSFRPQIVRAIQTSK